MTVIVVAVVLTLAASIYAYTCHASLDDERAKVARMRDVLLALSAEADAALAQKLLRVADLAADR